MAGAVGDEGDERACALTRRAGRVGETCGQRGIIGEAVVEQIAQTPHHVDVAPLIVATNVVSLAGAAAFNHPLDAAIVVVDKQPVADL